MDSSHRKIELQSPADLTYLSDKIRTAALSKLNLHLPPVADSTHPDDLRVAVEARVDAFVAAVLDGMRRNVSVNGIDVGDAAGDAAGDMGADEVAKEEFEPFDEKLRAQLAKAVQRRDALVGDISAHRRGTAAQAAAEWRARFEAEMQGAGRFEGGDAGEVEVEVMRQEEVERNWQRAVEGLARLNKGLPETRARLERCGDVVGYLGA